MNNTEQTYLIKASEAAKLASTSLPTIYAWTEREDFDALIRVGKRKLIIQHKFIAWLERMAENRIAL